MDVVLVWKKKKTTVDDIQSHLLEIFKWKVKGGRRHSDHWFTTARALDDYKLSAVPSAPKLNPLAEASGPLTFFHKFDLLKKK